MFLLSNSQAIPYSGGGVGDIDRCINPANHDDDIVTNWPFMYIIFPIFKKRPYNRFSLA